MRIVKLRITLHDRSCMAEALYEAHRKGAILSRDFEQFSFVVEIDEKYECSLRELLCFAAKEIELEDGS